MPVWEERTKACDALKHQRAKAPVVHGHRVFLSLDELWGLEDRREKRVQLLQRQEAASRWRGFRGVFATLARY